jgi:hypothetical protein
MLLISMWMAERGLVVSLCECVERATAGFDIVYEKKVRDGGCRSFPPVQQSSKPPATAPSGGLGLVHE